MDQVCLIFRRAPHSSTLTGHLDGGGMETRTVDGITEEPTLGALLRSVAYHRLPTQFYQMLQMAIPFAAQLWFWGWKRSAGWMVVVSLFGLWALCEQRVDELGERRPGPRGREWLVGSPAASRRCSPEASRSKALFS